ncbi:MAG: AI-2E family transporter [Verrucomicrobiia bacterium]
MNFPPPTPTQARLLWASLTAVAFGVLVTLVVVLLWAVGLVLQRLSSVLLPLAIAGIVAYLLDPLVDRLERRGLPRARAIICVFALFTVTVGALIGSVVPQIVNETRELTLRIPDYARNVQQKVETWIDHPPPRLSKWFDFSILTGKTNAPPAERQGVRTRAGFSHQQCGHRAGTGRYFQRIRSSRPAIGHRLVGEHAS